MNGKLIFFKFMVSYSTATTVCGFGFRRIVYKNSQVFMRQQLQLDLMATELQAADDEFTFILNSDERT